MINIKDHKTPRFFDPWDYMQPKRRKLLEESWAGLFREQLLCELPVEAFFDNFDSSMGRPTKELFTAIGAVLLQQTFDLTDEETVDHLAFNSQWHYALDITDESDASKYISPKTIWNIRKIYSQGGKAQATFDAFTLRLAEVFGVDFDKQRLDSVHIQSNMRRLGRIGIFVKVIKKFLANLKRHHSDLFESLDEELASKYTKKKSLNCFAMVKPSESAKTLQSCAEDLYKLVETFAGHADVMSMSSYRLMLRVLDEQCEVKHSLDPAEPAEVKARPSKDVPSDSLQNPSDPDATYDGHKGQGYQGQLQESYSKIDDPEEKAQTPNLLTHIEAETACEHDSNAVMPAIESCKEKGLAPKELLADSLYGSDANCEAAGAEGVELVSPAMGGAHVDEERLALSEFEFSEDFELLKCPAGHAPVKFKRNKNGFSSVFNSRLCSECPLSAKCPVERSGTNRSYLRYKAKDVRLSLRRAYELTEEFKDRYRMRSGVEATMSEFDRLTGVKHLRVRGMDAVRLSITLKACGLNILRATHARKARIRAGKWSDNGKSAFLRSISFFKELISAYLSGFAAILPQPEKISRGFGKTYKTGYTMAA